MSETELVKRLERLERDNRRLKRVAPGAVALLAVAAGLGAAHATPAVPERIVAHEFDVVDAKGRVRIRMSVSNSPARDATIDVSDGSGVNRVSIRASEPGLGIIELSDPKSLKGVLIEGPPSRQAEENAASAFPNAPFPSAGIYLSGVQSLKDLTKAGKPTQPYFWAGSGILLTVSTEGAPTVKLRDGQGYSMDVGSTDIVTPTTGHSRKTSAASIVMFGNDKQHRVIWQAPQ